VSTPRADTSTAALTDTTSNDNFQQLDLGIATS
jgi:hypothetical protein